jgi:hypothetical protein
VYVLETLLTLHLITNALQGYTLRPKRLAADDYESLGVAIMEDRSVAEMPDIQEHQEAAPTPSTNNDDEDEDEEPTDMESTHRSHHHHVVRINRDCYPLSLDSMGLGTTPECPGSDHDGGDSDACSRCFVCCLVGGKAVGTIQCVDFRCRGGI